VGFDYSMTQHDGWPTWQHMLKHTARLVTQSSKGKIVICLQMCRRYLQQSGRLTKLADAWQKSGDSGQSSSFLSCSTVDNRNTSVANHQLLAHMLCAAAAARDAPDMLTTRDAACACAFVLYDSTLSFVYRWCLEPGLTGFNKDMNSK
jgi:hypothetical protein